MNAAREAKISREQIGILTHELVEGRLPGYCVAYAVRVRGALAAGALLQVVRAIGRRHDVLRSAFAVEGAAIKRFVHDGLDVDFAETATAAATDAGRNESIARAVDREVRAGFDTARPPLWRVRILAFDATDRAVLLIAHHAVVDGWSMNLLIEELIERLADSDRAWPPPTDYGFDDEHDCGPAARQRPASERREADDTEFVLPNLQADRLAEATAGASVEHRLSAQTVALLQQGVKRLRATPNTILTATWLALLARYCQSGAAAVVITFAMRRSLALERMVGPCHTAVPLRVAVAEEHGFAEHVAKVRAAVAQAMGQAGPRWSDDAGAAPQRPGSSIPRTRFTVHPGALRSRTIGGLTFEFRDCPIPGSIGDADVFAYEETGGWRLLLTFRRAVMGAADARDVLRQFETLLRAGLQQPAAALGSLPLIETAGALSAAAAWRHGPPAAPLGGGMVARFTARAAAAPDEVAIIFGASTLTRAELLRRSQHLAAALLAAGAGAGHRVGICLPRSPALAVAELAVRMIDGSFVPLDPNGPPERSRAISRDAGIRLIIHLDGSGAPPCAAQVAVDIVGGVTGLSPIRSPTDIVTDPPFDPDREAYILFTSGSSGRPKGVICCERALLRQIGDSGGWIIGPDDVVLAAGAPTFDLSVFEIWNGLLAARRLVILDPKNHSIEGLGRLIVAAGVTFMMVVPRIFHDLLQRCPGALRSMRQINVGGDVNDAADFAHCRADYPTLRLTAIYGPTETGVTVTAYQWGGDDEAATQVPIGTPLTGTRVAVVDHRGRPMPPGVPGELVIGGDAVEPGYLDDSEARFRPDPLEPCRRAFWTGDRVKMRRDGVLEFLGRADRQIKIAGHRMEPAEIEAAGMASGCLEACVAAMRPAGDGEMELIAVVVLKPALPGDDALARLRASLRERLPAYAVPAHIHVADALPISSHGKIDVNALLAQAASLVPEPQPRSEEATELVLNLAARVLGHANIAPSTNFFAAGGHSLAALDLCRRLSLLVGREIPMRLAFEAPTLGAMAADLDRVIRGATLPAPLPPVTPASAPVPASLAQQRLLTAAASAAPGLQAVTPLPFMLHAPVDRGAVEAAIRRLLRRHPILAGGFCRESDGRLFIRPVDDEPSLCFVDLAPMRREDRPQRMRQICRELMSTRRQLETEPPIRVVLFSDPPDGAVLLIILDHIAYDGRSIAIVARDVASFYARGGAPENDGTGRLSFSDYAAWEADRDQDGTIDRLCGLAADRLGGPGARLFQPVWGARAAQVTETRVQCGADRFRAFAQGAGVTVFAAVLAVMIKALTRAQGGERLRIAVQASTRLDHGLLDVVGPFMNTTYLDVAVVGDLDELARAVQRELLAAQDFSLVPIDRLRAALYRRGVDPDAVLPDVLFALQLEEGEPDPAIASRITPLDPLDGWDSETFAVGYGLVMLATLGRAALHVRFGLHPALADKAAGPRFAAALRACCSGMIDAAAGTFTDAALHDA